MTVVSVAEVDLKSLIVTCPLTVVKVAEVDRRLLDVNSPVKVGLPPTVVRVEETILNPPWASK